MKKCENCQRLNTELNLFLCKGRMVCQACYMEITHNNTIFFDETKYPRIRDSHGNLIPNYSKKMQIILDNTNTAEIELNNEKIGIESEQKGLTLNSILGT